MGAQQDLHLSSPLSDDGLKMATENMAQLITSLEKLSDSIGQLSCLDRMSAAENQTSRRQSAAETGTRTCAGGGDCHSGGGGGYHGHGRREKIGRRVDEEVVEEEPDIRFQVGTPVPAGVASLVADIDIEKGRGEEVAPVPAPDIVGVVQSLGLSGTPSGPAGDTSIE